MACDNCHEEIEPKDEPIRRGDRVYCCEACAFEASRSPGCGWRGDSHIAKPVVEQALSLEQVSR